MRRFILTPLLLLLTVGWSYAQNPQTQTAPLYGTNSRWVNGISPGYWPTDGGGLTLNISSGTVNCNGTETTYAGGTLSLTGSTTNYVYLDSAASCAPAFNTTGFSAGNPMIAKVVTGPSSITTITDDRTPFRTQAVPVKYSPSLTPAAATVSSCTDQTFTVTGLLTTQSVYASPPSSLGTHLWIGDAFVSATNTLDISFCSDATGGTPPSGTWLVTAY